MASQPSCDCEKSSCASYMCACKLRGDFCNDYCFCSGRSCSNRPDGPLLHSPRLIIPSSSSPSDGTYLSRSPGLSNSAPVMIARPWHTLSAEVFGSPKQLMSSDVISQQWHNGHPNAHSPGSPPQSPSKGFLRAQRKKRVSALDIPRTPGPSPSSLTLGSPISLLPSFMQPKFHFNQPGYSQHQDQYDADRQLFLQHYMLIAEEFLYAFLEAWHSNSISTLSCFRESSELIMDDQLYLGSDCVSRLASETSHLNPTYVEVMPSKEGFEIGIAINGDLKSSTGILSSFAMEFILRNDGTWFIANLKAV